VLVIWIAGFALLWIPGLLISRLLRLRAPVAIQLALGLSFWPLLLLWSSTAGLEFSVWSARAVAGAIAFAAAIILLRQNPLRRTRYAERGTLFVLAVIFALAIATRVSHVHDLVLPAWVDSIHHTAIIRMIVERGQLPDSYDPLIPQGVPYYHWGYHATVAFLVWLLGELDPFAIAKVILHFGQLLNALTVLFVYTAGRALFRSSRAGLIAATLAGLVSYFPAYYVSWGRYTHLTGVLLLLAFGPALWRLSLRRHVRELVPVALIASGLILVHVRIAFFALTFALCLALLVMIRSSLRAPRSSLLWWSSAALIALVLVSPWLWRLAQIEEVTGMIAPGELDSAWRTPADIRASHLWVPRNRELLALATGGLTGLLGWPRQPIGLRLASVVLWLLVLVCAERTARKRRAVRSPWQSFALLAGWVGLTALLLNLDAFGFPPLQFASNTAAVISLFIPLSLAGGGIAAWVLACLTPLRWLRALTATLVLGIAVAGAAGLRDVVNPGTILADARDLEALRWIRANTPPSARFGIRAREWLNQSWVGIDGGYWISVLTDRGSTVPPALYQWASKPELVQQINFNAEYFSRTEMESDARIVWWLQRAGVTHLYFGPRPGEPSSNRFGKRTLGKLVYDRNGVRIVELR
jgi:hypothetical protein